MADQRYVGTDAATEGLTIPPDQALHRDEFRADRRIPLLLAARRRRAGTRVPLQRSCTAWETSVPAPRNLLVFWYHRQHKATIGPAWASVCASSGVVMGSGQARKG